MLIVADTSALLALVACDGLPLLDALFQEIRVPPAVFRECTVPGKPGAEHLDRYLCTRVTEIDLSAYVIAATGLGRGELEAMALHKCLHADRLLVDDSRARKIAQFNAIAIIGSVGVLLQAKKHALIPTIRSPMEAIQAAGIHIGEQLFTEALRLAGEA